LNTIENTLFTGKVLHHVEALDSTNLYAAQWLATHKPIDGMVFSSYHQRKGRGQIGSSWWSEPYQNLAISIVLLPEFLAAKNQFLLNQAISLGVYDTVIACIEGDVRIKWPNDIYVGKRKVAGILIQNSLSATKIQTSIIGVGINVNQETFPADLPNPTSFFLESTRKFSLDQMRSLICQKIEAWYLQLKEGNIDVLQQTYLNRLFWYGEEQLFRRADQSLFKGIIKGVQNSGKLIVASEKGEECFDLKAIRFMIETEKNN